MTTELATITEARPVAPAGALDAVPSPEAVLERAASVARALQRVIESGNGAHYVELAGRRHLRLEAWTTLGVLHGLTAEIEWTRRVQDPDGWEARAVVRRGDVIISAAEAQCCVDEPEWRARVKYAWRTLPGGRRERYPVGEEPVPDYARRSMAQTRALSKALRLALSWVVVLAGYDPTPAEELPEAQAAPVETPQRRPEPQPAPRLEEPPEADPLMDHIAKLLKEHNVKARALCEVLGIQEPDRNRWREQVREAMEAQGLTLNDVRLLIEGLAGEVE
jgi:hypothetical protein